MSNASSAVTFTLGAGGGFLLWYLLRDARTRALPTTPDAHASGATPATAQRACALRLDSTGLTADGARVGVADAVARCKGAGRADVTVVHGAPAATYADLMIALGRAEVPSFAHRNARARRRHEPRTARIGATGVDKATRNAETSTEFTLITYTQGFKASPRLRWFRSEAPITWAEARDRLGAARLLDLGLAGRTREPGGWMLSIDPHHFRADRAEPLPGGSNG